MRGLCIRLFRLVSDAGVFDAGVFDGVGVVGGSTGHIVRGDLR